MIEAASQLRAWTHAQTVLDRVELPAGVTDLDTGLTDVDGDDLAHGGLQKKWWLWCRTGGLVVCDGGKEKSGVGISKSVVARLVNTKGEPAYKATPATMERR